VAEGRGDRIAGAAKGVVVYRQARLLRWLEAWDEEARRQFAADCLEHVLQAYTHCYPHHRRVIAFVKDCLEVLRDRAGNVESLLSCKEAQHAWKSNPVRWFVSTAVSFLENFKPGLESATPYRYARVLTAALACPRPRHDDDWDAARDNETEWQARRLAQYLGLQDAGIEAEDQEQ